MKLLLTLCLSLFVLQAQNLPNSKQVIVVTTENWSTPEGVLQRYEQENDSWVKVGQEITILLGRNGLGWGIGLHETPKDAMIIKKEGDGKAPAGIFSLKQAFGYFPFEVDYPYEVYKSTDHCVDDVNSKLYNKIVDSSKVTVDYQSKPLSATGTVTAVFTRGRKVKQLSDILPEAARALKFELKLEKADEWQLVSATWKDLRRIRDLLKSQ